MRFTCDVTSQVQPIPTFCYPRNERARLFATQTNKNRSLKKRYKMAPKTKNA